MQRSGLQILHHLESRAREGAWLAVHIVALVTLLFYGVMGFGAHHSSRLLLESSGATQSELQRTFLEDPGRSVPALLLSVVIGSIATAAGVGGGAFFVPLFNILLEFSVKSATALSQAVIAGGAIAGVAVTLHKKHPYDPNATLIDFDLALMLLPVLLLGVSLGVLGNELFPSWLITVLLLVLLLFLTERTVRKALKLHKDEKRYLAEHPREQGGEAGGKQQRRGSKELPSAEGKVHQGQQGGAAAQQAMGSMEAAAGRASRAQSVPLKQQGSGGDPAQPAGPAATSQPRSSGDGSPRRRGSVHFAPQEPAGDGSPLQGGSVARPPSGGGRLSPRRRGSVEFSAQQAGPVAAAHARGSADEAPHRGGKVHPAAQKLRQGGSQPGGMDAGAGTVGSGQGVPNGQAAGSSSSSSATPFAAVAKVGLSGPGSEGGARRDSASGSRVPVFDGMARGSPRHASALHTEEGAEGQGTPEDEQPARPNSWVSGGILVGCWAVFVTLQLLLSRYSRCSWTYSTIYAVQAALCLVTECFFVRLVHKRKQAVRRPAQANPLLVSAYKESLRWTLPRIIRSVVITLVSGAIAGLLGIGGGMIISPLLLAFDTHPRVAAATSTLMVLFSASSAALSFGFSHALNLQFALVFGLCCMVASLAGVLIVQRVVQRSGKASIIVFLLACVIGLGATLTAAFGGRFAIQDLIHHNQLGFSSLCASSKSG